MVPIAKGKTMDMLDWVNKYEDKTGEDFINDEGYNLLYDKDRGFCEVSRGQDMLIARQMCGDALFWRNTLEDIARNNGLKHIGTYCIRKIKPYIRLFGFKIYKVENTSAGERYFCIDKNTGQKAQCSPAWITKQGLRAYYITWEVT